MRFEVATVLHARVLAALHESCFAGESASGPETWSALLAAADTEGLLALDDQDVPLGFVVWRLAAGEAEIVDVGVLPESRGQGLGRRLLGRAVDACAAAGAERLFLEVAEDNAPARALYAAAGFEAAGRRPRYYRRRGGERVDALVLALGLSPLSSSPLSSSR